MGNTSAESTPPPPTGLLAPAQAVALEGLVALAPGAIVSRTLLKNTGGNITLFSFDAGQGLSEHTAPFDAFVQILSGRIEFVIGGEALTATAGQAVVMPAAIAHGLKALEPSRMLLVMIREPK